MKITDVRAYTVLNRSIFVRVFTDEGITGLGECSPMNVGSGVIQQFVNGALRPLCVGQNPLEVDKLWSAMFYRNYKLGVMGAHLSAIAGVDIALWDILGKVTKLPIHTLLGGCYRETVRMYASLGGGSGRTPAQHAQIVADHLEKGYTAIKIRMDWGYQVDIDPDKDWAMFQECKNLTGDKVPLSFDANNGYSPATAIQQGRRFESLGIYHFEEPVAVDDYAGYAEVARALDVPVSAGEHEYTRWQFRDLIERAQVDIIQPDVIKCGGFTEIRRIAALGEIHHKHIVPHMTQPTIGTAANLHFIASLRDANRPQEFSGVNDRLNALFKEPLLLNKGGTITVPTRPGLGLELDEAAFEKAIGER
jgi:L-alanine-DL-glutamate epimerase-like enolase superfamily enzyme